MRIVTPHKRPRHGLRRLISLNRCTLPSQESLLGAIRTEIHTAVANILNPNVAVEIKFKVLSDIVASIAGENWRDCSSEISPGVALECVVGALWPGLVVEKLDRW